MCLVSKRKEPYTATKEIVGYKYIIDKGHYWESPFQHTKHPYGRLINKESKITKSCMITPYIEVSNGYFHFLIDNIRPGNIEFLYKILKISVVECIIPKGAHYYIGRDNDICADEIIIYKDKEKKDNPIILFFKTIINKIKRLWKKEIFK